MEAYPGLNVLHVLIPAVPRVHRPRHRKSHSKLHEKHVCDESDNIGVSSTQW